MLSNGLTFCVETLGMDGRGSEPSPNTRRSGPLHRLGTFSKVLACLSGESEMNISCLFVTPSPIRAPIWVTPTLVTSPWCTDSRSARFEVKKKYFFESVLSRLLKEPCTPCVHAPFTPRQVLKRSFLWAAQMTSRLGWLLLHRRFQEDAFVIIFNLFLL